MEKTLEENVRGYVSKSLQSLPEKRRGIFLNPMLSWLMANDGVNGEVEEEVKEDFTRALASARTVEDRYESGLCMGFLNPVYEVSKEELSEVREFRAGVIDGQAYRLKIDGKRKREASLFARLGLFSLGVFYFARSEAISFPSEEIAEKAETIANAAKMMMMGGIVYGFSTMVKRRLFCRDAHLSKKLITDGAFSLHRNPFYASAGFVTTTFLGNYVLQESMQAQPNMFGIASISASIALGLTSLHKRALDDEVSLAKKFGEVYEDYKRTTPRYIPAVWKLFARKRRIKHEA